MSAIQARLNGVLGRTSMYEAVLGLRLLFCNSHNSHANAGIYREHIYFSRQLWNRTAIAHFLEPVSKSGFLILTKTSAQFWSW
jgi:hypothetical protein